MSKWISDLEPWNEDKPKKLSVGDACRRIKDFRLRLNQLTQDIELDGQPLEAETVEEAYIDFSLINYAITKDQAISEVISLLKIVNTRCAVKRSYVLCKIVGVNLLRLCVG